MENIKYNYTKDWHVC